MSALNVVRYISLHWYTTQESVALAGPLTSQQTDLFLRNQRFAGLKFPDMHRPETLEHRFGHLLDSQAMSFLT